MNLTFSLFLLLINRLNFLIITLFAIFLAIFILDLLYLQDFLEAIKLKFD